MAIATAATREVCQKHISLKTAAAKYALYPVRGQFQYNMDNNQYNNNMEHG